MCKTEPKKILFPLWEEDLFLSGKLDLHIQAHEPELMFFSSRL